MKRIVFAIITLISIPLLFAASDKDLTYVTSGHMDIGGFYNTEMGINVIALHTAGGDEGMPFNLLGSDVQAGSSGRVIAQWAATSNAKKAKVEVEADHMACTSSTPKEQLPYALIFQYSTDGGLSTRQARANSGSVPSTIEIESSTSTISLYGTISFVLVSDAIEDDENYPEGDYMADVRLVIKGV